MSEYYKKQDITPPNLKAIGAFSAMELLVGIAVVAVISTVSILILNNYRYQRDLELSVNEIVAALRDAQNRSITQQDGQSWGIRFTNSTSSSDVYEMFRGPNYASGTVTATYSFRRPNVEMADPAGGSSKEIVFNSITGAVSSYFSITIRLVNKPSEQRVIEVAPVGKISFFDGQALVVSAINPNSGTNNGSVNINEITGANFQTGAAVKLTKSGQTDITGSGFTVTSYNTIAGGSFNLTNATTGPWNVVVINPDNQSSTLSGGFTVTSGPGTIDSTHRWAWSDNAGWFDFAAASSNVVVSNSAVTGKVWNDNYGWLYLDCGTLGNCGISFSVTNTSAGILAGWAWNDSFGWVSFNCSNDGSCGTVNYKVTIDSNGDFQGWAWSDTIGWISFNCVNEGTCGTVQYKVKTSWTPV